VGVLGGEAPPHRKGLHMDIEGIDRLVKRVQRYVQVMGVEAKGYRIDPLAANVEKGVETVSLRAQVARLCGLRLYPGESYDLLTLRDTVRSGPFKGPGITAAGTRPASETHVPPATDATEFPPTG